MKEILIQLRCKDDPTQPPLRCPDTGRTVKEVTEDLKTIAEGKGFSLKLQETTDKISERFEESLMAINGLSLEEITPLPDPRKYCGMACSGCGGGDNDSCQQGFYREIPESVLRLAVMKQMKNNL
ncbi:DUF2703 domain-containing protein [Methanoplanus sp. FWC-SCC4]|uniref:DUF2703 domain-containing protein n=1 Tax=Methanochimaera problematica TaxID=2609417 RepID=A0AA97FE78_9EURY|nr:DUF2703 domain-containing protein [Methanoplanus sp. FWC-SCC4]WOF16907.1 DUF2703 domain-containing protein [Methanoplanus sp. FWC-SCC4]